MAQDNDPGGDDTTPHAERFNNARSAQSMALLEDYTEMIDELMQDFGEARVADIARCGGPDRPLTTS